MAERLVAEFVVEHVPEALSGGDPMLLATSPARDRRRHCLGRCRNPAKPDRHRFAQASAGAALMDFTLTPDQDALVSAVDKLAAQFETKPTDSSRPSPSTAMNWNANWKRPSTSISRRFRNSVRFARQWLVERSPGCPMRQRLRSRCSSGHSCPGNGRGRWRWLKTADPDASLRQPRRSW
jgi:hypothetical protein